MSWKFEAHTVDETIQKDEYIEHDFHLKLSKFSEWVGICDYSETLYAARANHKLLIQMNCIH